MKYYINTTIETSFDEAVERVTQALQAQGFGILSDIDVQATLKKKLDKTIRPYRILGACNPPFADKSLAAEPWIGLMLPCNVVIQQNNPGQIEVAAINPLVAMQGVNNDALKPIAGEVAEKLKAAIASL